MGSGVGSGVGSDEVQEGQSQVRLESEISKLKDLNLSYTKSWFFTHQHPHTQTFSWLLRGLYKLDGHRISWCDSRGSQSSELKLKSHIKFIRACLRVKLVHRTSLH